MNTEETPEVIWTIAEENVLALAREIEWAEAYAENHLECSMGTLYLSFLRWEMVMAQGAL